ncbi:MAG: acyl-CoA thioesterase [Candidatus Geothermarchaeales archaeon]
MSSFVHPIRVSWADTDAGKVVHFSNYFKFFEKAEEAFYRTLGVDFDAIEDEFGIWIPRVEAFCQYKSPAKFNDLLEAEMRVAEVSDKTVRYEFMIRNRADERTIAQGHIVAVAVEKKTGTATKIPDKLRERLSPPQRG